jgi:hypothetical protein
MEDEVSNRCPAYNFAQLLQRLLFYARRKFEQLSALRDDSEMLVRSAHERVRTCEGRRAYLEHCIGIVDRAREHE